MEQRDEEGSPARAVRRENAKPPFVLEGIDHILLLVNGMKPAVRFYTDVLWLHVVTC